MDSDNFNSIGSGTYHKKVPPEPNIKHNFRFERGDPVKFWLRSPHFSLCGIVKVC